jgi:ABC-type uncharacterized transport system permease subunit
MPIHLVHFGAVSPILAFGTFTLFGMLIGAAVGALYGLIVALLRRGKKGPPRDH